MEHLYCVPGGILGTEDRAVNETDDPPPLPSCHSVSEAENTLINKFRQRAKPSEEYKRRRQAQTELVSMED